MRRHKKRNARQTRQSVCAYFSALILLTSLPGLPVAHAAQTLEFNIPAQPLTSALADFSAKTRLQVLYEGAVTDNVQAPALEGQYTPKAALGKLLENSGIQYRFTNRKTITLEPINKSSLSTDYLLAQAPKENYPPTVVDDESSYTGPVEQVEMTVRGGEWNGYNVLNASTATKTDTPILDTPFSVQVVPQQVLQDQQVVRLDKALQNVSGVTVSPVNQGASDGFQIRGFQSTTMYRDGFLLPTIRGGGSAKREMANIERVEVLKGPGSLLYGRTEPGGIVNMVTKQPLDTPYYSLQQQVGSYAFYRTTLDTTGPITKDDTLLYRLNLSYENSGSFRDFINNESVFLAPVLKWNISPQTQATFELEYQHFNQAPDPGIPPLGSRPAPIPIKTALHEPLANKDDGDRILVGFNWSHQFNDDWKLSQKFFSEFFDKNSQTLSFAGPAQQDGGITRRFNISPDTQSDRYFTTLNLTGNVAIGPVKNKLLFGFDYFVMDDRINNRTCCPPVGPFNIFDPVYLTSPPTFSGPGVFRDFTQSWYGLYLQDQIELPYNIHLLGGVRYDNAEGENNILKTTTIDDDHVSPRGGLLWQPLEWLSVYGNYSENFSASFSMFNPTPIPPETAQEWEAGLKTEFWGGRLGITAAYYELTKQNIRTTDPDDLTKLRAIGEAETHGLEFDLTGEILPGWNVIATYTYMPFAEITKDFDRNGGTGNEGNRLFLAPENTGSFWSTYEFESGYLKGLKFGAGALAVGPRQGNAENTYQLPGYVTANLMASYQMKLGSSNITAQLNVDNLLDKRYFAGTNSVYFITPGAPRTFLGSLRIEF